MADDFQKVLEFSLNHGLGSEAYLVDESAGTGFQVQTGVNVGELIDTCSEF